eukprot:4180871-Prymnesium_polylepis.2
MARVPVSLLAYKSSCQVFFAMEGAPLAAATRPAAARAAVDAAATVAVRALYRDPAVEADIVITCDAVAADADGANLDTLVMTWRHLGPWRRRPKACSALDATTLSILREAWDVADFSPERNALRRTRQHASRNRYRAAAGQDESDRRVRQRREDPDQQRRDRGARARTYAARAPPHHTCARCIRVDLVS